MHLPTDHIAKDGFRLRGTQMSRIDAFSDVVFGFALTLIVVSLEVPKNFVELHNLLRGFFPFGLTFLMLMLIWHTHYKFFRRFNVHDTGTLWLNGLLLFTVLFYVYPLKFIFFALFNGAEFADLSQLRELTLLYAGGFVAIYAIFAGMYANALRQRQLLALSALELRLTRIYILEEAGNALVGIVVIIVALILPARLATLATFCFALITIHKRLLGQQTRLAKDSLAEGEQVDCSDI